SPSPSIAKNSPGAQQTSKYLSSSGQTWSISRFAEFLLTRAALLISCRHSARGHRSCDEMFRSCNQRAQLHRQGSQLPAPNVSSVDLDSRYSKKENKEEKKLHKENNESDEASKEIPRPIPDGEFELVLLGEDPSKGVNIGTGLPDLVRK
ncbi:hypothetical protein A2U01_0024511, partial [Trifolium medium]|nr:hypothetical protein [Trifolium medium]